MLMHVDAPPCVCVCLICLNYLIILIMPDHA